MGESKNFKDELRFYHLISSKKLPRGMIKVDLTVYVPHGELNQAFEEIRKMLVEDLELQTSTT